MRAITGAAVAIHAADVAWLRAGRVAPGGRHARFGAVLDALPIMGWTPVKPDLELADGDLLDGVLRVVHVPGHTAGHIALLHEPSRTVLVGDALFHRSGLTLGPAALAEDPAGRPAGLRALPPDVAAVGFAHGAPLSGTATEIYQQFLHARSAT